MTLFRDFCTDIRVQGCDDPTVTRIRDCVRVHPNVRTDGTCAVPISKQQQLDSLINRRNRRVNKYY